ncbi:hypothetical protein HHJ78_08295 [Mobiluncus mulieris]|uniref:Uncharacterized protein n=1 Tax=Mobiluncus mulieris TaxID=2052 RepID=A0A7Y0U229_9ACTO|nr:hypothetical protein [Mobiluncus mulieris]
MGVLAKKERTSLLWWHVGEMAAFWLCGGALLIHYAALLPLWGALGLHVLGILIYYKVSLLIMNRCPDLPKEVTEIYRKNRSVLVSILLIAYVAYWLSALNILPSWLVTVQGFCGVWILAFSIAVTYRSWRFRDTGGHPVPWNDPVWKDWRFYPGW